MVTRNFKGFDHSMHSRKSSVLRVVDHERPVPRGSRDPRPLRVVLFALAIAIALAVPLLSMPKPSNETKLAPIPAEVTYAPHPTIYINGNAQFNNTVYPSNGVVSGNGTASNPYVIEGWDITASSAMGIYIRSTDLHFVIRNCYIHGGGMDYYGVLLAYCTNGTVSANNMSYNNCGIGLQSSSRIIIVDNMCYSNENVDIYIAYSSNNNTVNNNSCSDNEHIGIALQGSNGNTVTNNTCTGVGIGIYLMQSSRDNVIFNNSCCSNKYTGIELQESGNNIVDSNNCSNNQGAGIYFIMSSHGNILSNNTCNSNDPYGVIIQQSNSNCLSYNNISSNPYGMYFIQGSSYNNLSWNRLFGNSDRGVYIQEGSYNRFWNNTFIGNGGGQAYDSGTNNWWNTSGYPHGYGNYWSDLTAPDSNLDGIVDWSYNLTGSAGAKDYYPRTTPPVPIPELVQVPSVAVVILAVVLILGEMRRRRVR